MEAAYRSSTRAGWSNRRDPPAGWYWATELNGPWQRLQFRSSEDNNLKAVVVPGDSQFSRNPGAVLGALSPLVDRPFLQHVVETVVGQGIREIHFILPEEDRDARGILGDGTRWGAHFRYHTPPGKRRVYDAFKTID